MAVHRLRLGLTMCLLVLGVAGVVAVPAFGFETHLFEGSFGEEGVIGSHFSEGRPGALAIDPVTGSIYVGDGFYHNAVQKFDSAHAPEVLTGIGPNISMNTLGGFNIGFWQLAVSPTSENLYVVSGGPVEAFRSNGEPADFTAGSAAGTNELPGTEVCGVAVDGSGNIYVSEYESGVSVFSASGEPLTKLAAPGLCDLAVDSNGVVYANALPTPENGVPGIVERFVPSGLPPVSASTTYEAAGSVDANGAFALAIDPHTNRLFVDEGDQVAEYDEAGDKTGAFGFTEPGALPGPGRFGTGLAVNGASGRVYVGQGDFEGQVEVFGPAILLPDANTGKASEIEPSGTATLNGTVNPDGVEVTECYFEYGTSTEYGQRAACEQTVGSGTGEVAVTAKLTGLAPGAIYHFRLVASNKTAPNGNPANDGADETLNTPPRPAVSATSTSNLTSSSVDLEASVNPGGLEVTECRFEYGTGTEYGQTVACEQTAGSGTSNVPVSAHLEGLSANVTYHWRLVASNAAGTTLGADQTFIYDTSGEGLPDHRAYEMVTPPHKNGALIGDLLFGIKPDFSEDGSRVIMGSIQCFAEAETCTADREEEGEPFLFSRTGSGWVTTALTPPGKFEVNTVWGVSAETGSALFSAPTAPMGEDDFYVRGSDGSFADIGPGTPPADGVQGYPFRVIRGRSGFSRLVYETEASWWTGPFGEALFEYDGVGSRSPSPVGVSGGPGNTDLISSCGEQLGEEPGAVSANGETVYFRAGPCESGTGANARTSVPVAELFARIGQARTVAVSEPSAFGSAAPYPGCEEASCVKDVNEKVDWSAASFVGASDDGSKAFFTSGQRLTDDAASEDSNLYEYDQNASSSEHLIDVSAGDTSGRDPQVRGVVAISADGSHVYFVAGSVLTRTGNALGQTALEGANNLYVFSRSASDPKGGVGFVAQLPEADHNQWEGGGDNGLANVTPDGQFLVFESYGDLTPDDTRTDGAAQIFRYDAQVGELVRISVGERGFNDDGNAGSGNAQIVEARAGWYGGDQPRSDPTMSHDGSFIFFESPIALTPHSLNDIQVATFENKYEGVSRPVYAENVYEWHEGRVYLISDGRDTTRFNEFTSAVKLLYSDATGANVFFRTADPLVPQDTDTQVDYYDARICEPERGNPCVSQPLPPLPPCLGEACHGTPAEAPQVPGAPTATFEGHGNVSGAPVGNTAKGPKKRSRGCIRGKRRVHGRCQKAPPKSKGTPGGKGRKARKTKRHGGGHR